MKSRTSTLTGPALDWAVAKCEGTLGHYLQPNEKRGTTTWAVLPQTRRYSTDWAQGGLIIDRHDIDILRDCADNKVELFAARTGGMVKHPTRNAMVWGFSRGPTKLIAAMRCFVTSKLGDEVDVPEELVV